MKKPLLSVILMLTLLYVYAEKFTPPQELIKKLTFAYSYDSEEAIAQMQDHIDFYIPDFTDRRVKADYLNRAGFALYENQEYLAALSFFYYAMEIDRDYRYPFYNFVCTKGLLDKQLQDDPCHTLAPDAITVNALTHAIRLYPGYKEKMMIDPDLELYRNLPWFLDLSGISIFTRTGCMEILERSSTWHGNRPGLYPTSEIDFFENGIVEMRFFTFDFDTNGDYIEEWIVKKGTYQDIAGGQIIIHLEDSTEYLGEFKKEIYGYSTAHYYLVLTDDLGRNPKYYCVYPDPCSA